MDEERESTVKEKGGKKMSEDTIGLGTLLKDTNPADIDKFLATFSKYERLFDKGMNIIEKLDNMGILPAAIRAAGAKSGVKDIDRPLRDPLGLSATSPTHYVFYKFLNKIPSDKIEEMHTGLKKAVEEAMKETVTEEATVVEPPEGSEDGQHEPEV